MLAFFSKARAKLAAWLLLLLLVAQVAQRQDDMFDVGAVNTSKQRVHADARNAQKAGDGVCFLLKHCVVVFASVRPLRQQRCALGAPLHASFVVLADNLKPLHVFCEK